MTNYKLKTTDIHVASGIYPENLPPTEDIKKVKIKSRLKKDEKKIAGNNRTHSVE